MRAAVLGLGAVLTGAMTAPAGAATMVNADGVLTYTAAPGEVNWVGIERESGGSLLVRLYVPTPVTVQGCTQLPPENVVDGTPWTPYECGGVDSIVADLGDGDDNIAVHADVPATLSGGPGHDYLGGGTLVDRLDGGPGDDTLDMTPGDAVLGGSGVDTVSLTPAGPFTLALGASLPEVENVSLAYNADDSGTITGDDGANRLVGGNGADTITGGRGSDVLVGNAGDDRIDARDGDPDRVECGPGNDVVLADQYDQIGDTCESVSRELALNPLDDRPPSIAWASNASAKLAARPATTLLVTATDDVGVQKVEFFDDDQLLCTDTAAPFTCAYAPRIEDVGRDTLRAVATDASGQTASVLRAVTVSRFAPRSVSLRVARRGNRIAASGVVRLPAGVPCSGVLAVRTGATTHTQRLGRKCSYSLRFQRGRTFVATYRGTDAIASKRSTRKVVR